MCASAGGLGALTTVLSMLPASLPAAVLVVQHLDPSHTSMVPEILARRTPLRVKRAEEGDLIGPGCVYIGQPGRHLLLNDDGSLSLTDTPPVHHVRPSADVLFESVAACDRPAVAVVLTGTGSDGATGAVAIKKHGGRVIAQDRATSEFFGMPGAAIDAGSVDEILPLNAIADAIGKYVAEGSIA
jgi:two-component system chemotaxis response regulator CheB